MKQLNLLCERTPTPAPALVHDDCGHDRILHESKTSARCTGCGARMVRDRGGDWKAARS